MGRLCRANLLGVTRTTTGNTAADMNIPAPRFAPSASDTPSLTASALSLLSAATCAKQSGAPLPNESSVAPATSSGMRSAAAMFSSAGQKNRSATVART